jgi:uncharacterized protein
LELGIYFPNMKMPTEKFDNWAQSLHFLGQCLSKKRTTKKLVVFFDEFPWIANHKSNFLQEFEYWWNSWATKQQIIIIISGSATSWMLKNIRDNRGGLHNRLTRYIYLEPFTLHETKLFLQKKQMKYDHYHIAQLYMILGGIPFYLEDIERGESVSAYINRTCFNKTGILFKEFQNLYASLFDHPNNYLAVVRALASKHTGLSRQAIIEITGIQNGGGLTKVLTDLEHCSFIIKTLPYRKKKKDTIYRLIDEYTLFYLDFIENNQSKAKDIWLKKSQSPVYKIWQGFAFENLCFRHIEAIHKTLKIDGIETEVSSYLQKGKKDTPNIQIDMLIDRSDNCINLCEMKFYNDTYIYTKTASDKTRKLRNDFINQTQCKKAVFNTIITTYGINDNEYSTSEIDKVVTLIDLFSIDTF